MESLWQSTIRFAEKKTNSVNAKKWEEKRIWLHSFFMVAISLSSVAGNDNKRPIFLYDMQQVSQAEKLFSQVVLFERKVDQCVMSGIARAQNCSCLYPVRLNSMKRVLGDSLAIYPDWDYRTLLWWAKGSGKPLNIHLGRVSAWVKTVCADLAFIKP